jgi:hypothetical protein
MLRDAGATTLTVLDGLGDAITLGAASTDDTDAGAVPLVARLLSPGIMRASGCDIELLGDSALTMRKAEGATSLGVVPCGGGVDT